MGYGDIGQSAARLAVSFGMRVVALRRRAAELDGVVSRFYLPDGLLDLVGEADYLLCATPLVRQPQMLSVSRNAD